ncbi:hypothetical protein CDO73_01165 [Saccharibacillus sp. O23]|uniref:hypothetical protein n=1 Tax=Saccharibacillus sp. O23 TaxID=2009338 RepID=UPI000B4E5FEA|nr:hypothetical protein [Saccharibacillus sp. O23]OWR33143.1 hypothetical protein CDO73_01165 [Saccharibacillus sp. O23]
MRKKQHALLFAASALSIALFAEPASAPEYAVRQARAEPEPAVGAITDRGIPYVFRSSQTSHSGRHFQGENGYSGIEFSAQELQSSSTGYVHPYYRYTPKEILPLGSGQ